MNQAQDSRLVPLRDSLVGRVLRGTGNIALLVLGTVGVFTGGWAWTGIYFLSLIRVFPERPGAVVGIGTAPIALARRLADDLDADPENVLLATPEAMSDLTIPRKPKRSGAASAAGASRPSSRAASVRAAHSLVGRTGSSTASSRRSHGRSSRRRASPTTSRTASNFSAVSTCSRSRASPTR